MELPKFNETFMPILEILSDEKILRSRDLIRLVEEKYYSDLPADLLSQKTKSGGRLIENRIAWGKSYLKKGGFVHYPQRAHIQITSKGMAAKSNGVTLENLQSNSITFYQPEATKGDTPVTDKNDHSPQDLIDAGFKRIDEEVKTEILAKLKEVDPYSFEKVILILLNRMGYGDFIETSKSGDGGIDGIINEDKLGLEKIYMQAKRYSENKVRETDIRNFIGAMSGDTRKGIFVTTSNFDEKAKIKAREAHHSIILIDGEHLSDLMLEFNVGVQVKETYEVKDIDNDFFDSDEV